MSWFERRQQRGLVPFVLILSLVGYIYMLIRYGKKRRTVLNEQFEGFYSAAGAKALRVILTFFAVLFMLLILAFGIYFIVQSIRGEPVMM